MQRPVERNLLEAFLHGSTMISLAIGATFTVVGAIMAACGCGVWWLLLGAPLLLPAATYAFYARLARTP
jgi:hypothetical protein